MILSMNGLASMKEAALAEVRAVYAELAKRPIQRQCELRTECCQFQITGLTPQLTKGEAMLAAKAFRATGRKNISRARRWGVSAFKTRNGAMPHLCGPAFWLSNPFLRCGWRPLSTQDRD